MPDVRQGQLGPAGMARPGQRMVQRPHECQFCKLVFSDQCDLKDLRDFNASRLQELSLVVRMNMNDMEPLQ